MDPLVIIMVVLGTGLLLMLTLGRKSRKDKASAALLIGHYYSLTVEPSGYEVVRLLVVDDAGIHLKVFRNAFASRPTLINPADLVVGSPDDTEGFGIMHLPLKKEIFFAREPVHLMPGPPPSKEELWSYDLWLEKGGVLY